MDIKGAEFPSEVFIHVVKCWRWQFTSYMLPYEEIALDLIE